MEPSDALTSFENALRLAIRAVLGGEWTTAPGAPSLEALTKRMTEERARRDGVSVSTDLLDYAMTTDLTQLVRRNWEQFKPVFDDQKRTMTYFGIVEDVRNTIAHGREVMPHEKSLLAGATGQLRLQVSEYQSSADGSRTYYPTIERITDSFGNPPTDAVVPAVDRRRVNVGDVLSFSGYASGGRGRDVRWLLARMPTETPTSVLSVAFPRSNPAVVAVGNEVQFSYTVSESDVMEYFWIGIVIAADSKFHRHAGHGWDDVASFGYSVNPPLAD